MTRYGSILCLWLFATLFAAPLVAQAQAQSAGAATTSIFSCKDERGRTITSDRPIPECSSLPMRELRNDGALRRQIAPPLSRSEREELAREKVRQRAEALILKQEQTRDRALLQAYPDMAALEQSRDRQIADIQVQIDATYARMVKLHQELQAAQASARGYPPGKTPSQIRQQIAQTANSILSEDALVRSRLQEQENIRQRHADDAKRLRELLRRQVEAEKLAG